jgi:uncharacterized protein (DUF427 family)
VKTLFLEMEADVNPMPRSVNVRLERRRIPKTAAHTFEVSHGPRYYINSRISSCHLHWKYVRASSREGGDAILKSLIEDTVF